MPSIEQNEHEWSSYDWAGAGDEWSLLWGGPDYQWWGTLLPRLHEFVPTGTILEIAPGYGRWTRYLVRLCDRLIGVDLVPNCVEFCGKRFAGIPKASFHQNDGRSLEMVPDGQVDLAFSFDSLVHCERDVLEAYIGELARKLSPNGVAFIHHSNVGAYADPKTGELTCTNLARRGIDMSAELFQSFCREAGLRCVVQELVNWQPGEQFNDCFSVATPLGSKFERHTLVRQNPDFMKEAANLGKIAAYYGPRRFPRLADQGSGGGSLLRRFFG
jgi:SAM-dependent methyltransferase